MPTLDWLNRADAFSTAARVPIEALRDAIVSIMPGAERMRVEGLFDQQAAREQALRTPAEEKQRDGQNMAAQIRLAAGRGAP